MNCTADKTTTTERFTNTTANTTTHTTPWTINSFSIVTLHTAIVIMRWLLWLHHSTYLTNGIGQSLYRCLKSRHCCLNGVNRLSSFIDLQIDTLNVRVECISSTTDFTLQVITKCLILPPSNR